MMNLNRSLIFLGWVFLIAAPALHAGVASLTDAEVLRLKALVQASPEAEAWEKSIEKNAQEALSLPPNPISKIQSAGKLKGDRDNTQTQEALKDMARLWNLGLAYALTGDENYLSRANIYLKAWAQTCQPPDDPIDATSLEPLLETYDFLRPKIAPADRQDLDRWIRSVADTLMAADDPRKGSHWNNHQTHRLKTIAMVAFALNDPDLEKQALESLKTLMERDLNADGTTLDYLQRDALHYHFYDLVAFVRTAILYQRALNVDLYDYKTSGGASVSQCVAFGLPFARGEKTHAEFVHSTIALDAKRALNNETAFITGAPFDPKYALHCLELAQYYQPDLTALAGTLAGKPGSVYPTLQILLNGAMRPLPPVANGGTLEPQKTTGMGNPTLNPAPGGDMLKVDDFEAGNPNFGGKWWEGCDAYGQTRLEPVPFRPLAGGSPLSPGHCAGMKGRLIPPQRPYPWAVLALYLNAGDKAVDLSAYKALRFYTKGDGKTHLVALKMASIQDHHDFTAGFISPAEWTRVTLPLANFTQGKKGKQQGKIFNDVTELVFSPGTADSDFDFKIDDIEFVK